MSPLTILSVDIRQFDGFYSLNDLHKASGGAAKHRPNQFMRLDTTKALAEEIQCADSRSAFNVINGGPRRGTYVCKELVYAYGMWIRPDFCLKVIRAFDAMQSPAQPALPLLVTEGMAGQRVMVTFSEDGAHYAVKPIPSDCCVLTPRQFIKALGDPNGFFFDNQMLVDLLSVASRRACTRLSHLPA